MRFFTILLFAALTASMIQADVLVDTKIGPLKGTATDFRDGEVKFRNNVNGRMLGRSLDRIKSLKIIGQDDFNKAEALFAGKKYDDALAAYDEALGGASKAWIKSLITARQLQAAKAAGKFGEAVKYWLALVDLAKADKATLAMAPHTPEAKGKAGNAQAIRLLKNKSRQLGANQKPYRLAVLNLLLKTQQAQGDAKGAAATTAEIAKLTGNAPADASAVTGRDAPKPTPASSTPVRVAAGGTLGAAQAQIRAGKYDVAVKLLKDKFAVIPTKQRDMAYLLLGRALYEKNANAKTPNRNELAEAGVYLMWVSTNFPGSNHVPEALYLTAQVCKKLGNNRSAGLVLDEIVAAYGDDKRNTWVQKARKELPADSGEAE